jgi:hypothetical protein
MNLFLLLFVVVILLLWTIKRSNENYRSCRYCDGRLRVRDNSVINPFVYPYNGEENLNPIYAQASASKLQQQNTPDHDPLTN